MTRYALALALGVALLAAPDAAAQGDLRRVYQAIHPGPKYVAPKSSRSDSGYSWFGVAPGADLSAAAGLGPAVVGLAIVAAGIVTIPFWGPHELYDAGWEERGWFSPFPYRQDDRPYMVIGTCPPVPTCGEDYFDPAHVKPWGLRFSTDAGSDFDNLSRFGGQLFLDTSIHRLGLLANVNYYEEQLAGGLKDEALMSDVNLTWRVTQSERLLMHLGVGARLWTAHGETDGGFNALYRADLFPASGMHLSGLFEMGSLGDALVMHGQFQAGYLFRRGEVFVGYDFLRVKTVMLQGPTVGVRLWF